MVEGVNIHKRHMRKSPANPDGGIMEREFPIAYSNVMLIDPETKKQQEFVQNELKKMVKHRLNVLPLNLARKLNCLKRFE